MLTKSVQYNKTLSGNRATGNLKTPVKLGKKFTQYYYNLKNPFIYFKFILMALTLIKRQKSKKDGKKIGFFKAYKLIYLNARLENQKFKNIKKK